MIRLFLFFSLLSGSFMAFPAQLEVVVKGSFKGAEGIEIRMLEYADQISYREVEVTSATVNEKGEFQMSFLRQEPGYVFFRIDHARMGLFVEPGIEYLLQFDAVDFDTLNDRVNPYLNPWHFKFKVISPVGDLNQQINKLEEILSDYMEANFTSIYKSRNPAVFNPIRAKTDSVFEGENNSYFRNYYRYLYAYYLLVTNLKSPKDIAREYIYNQEILYGNTQYMNVFNNIFDTYIFAGSRKITLTDLKHTVNELKSYHALMDSLGKDTLLRNETLRELVMLKGLQDMYGNSDYKRENVESILTYIQTNSKFLHHRKIAGNILHERRKFLPGQMLPSFNLVTDEGDTLDMPIDFKGKYIYMFFWASWCESCFLDMVALNEVYTRHKDNVNIIGISIDRHLTTYQTSLNQQNFPWMNVHFRRNFRMLDLLDIRSLPFYVLIDREGKIISYPASPPTGDLNARIEWLLQQERRRER